MSTSTPPKLPSSPPPITTSDVRRGIAQNLDYLKRNTVRLKLLVSELVSCDLLTFNQADTILEQPTHLAMHEKLYTFLMEQYEQHESNFSTTTTTTTSKLLKAFRSSGNGHLVPVLTNSNAIK